jgi:hypothetical protein
MTPEEKVSAIATTARILSQIIPPRGAFENWPHWRQYLPHTTALLSQAGEELNTVEIVKICFSMGQYLAKIGRGHDLKTLSERSTKIRSLLLGDEHPETSKSMLLPAGAFFATGMRDKCEELEVKVVALSAKVLGEGPAYINLGERYINSGDDFDNAGQY